MFKKIAALSCSVLIGLVIAFARAGAFPFWNSDTQSQQAKSHPPASTVQTAQAEGNSAPAPANQPEPNESGIPIPSFAPLVKRVMPTVVNVSVVQEVKTSGMPFPFAGPEGPGGPGEGGNGPEQGPFGGPGDPFEQFRHF